jgi:hypothetical protein
MVAQIVVLSKVMYTHTNEHSLLHDNVLIYSIVEISQEDLFLSSYFNLSPWMMTEQ